MQRTKVDGLCIDMEILVMGQLENNVYLISSGEDAMVVDPTDHAEAIMEALGDKKLGAIVLTHSHWDHTGATAELRELSGAKVIASAEDAKYIEQPRLDGTSHLAAACKVDETVENGDVVTVGEMQWKVMETPGHSSGSICLFMIPQFGSHPDGLPVLISGDTLFAGATGRMDFERGSVKDMTASMKKLAKLPDDVVVCPGHGSLTTIGAERQTFARFGADLSINSNI